MTEERGRAEWDRAAELTREAAELLGRGDLDAAERTYRAALDVWPELEAAWFDLGLVHQW